MEKSQNIDNAMNMIKGAILATLLIIGCFAVIILVIAKAPGPETKQKLQGQDQIEFLANKAFIQIKREYSGAEKISDVKPPVSDYLGAGGIYLYIDGKNIYGGPVRAAFHAVPYKNEIYITDALGNSLADHKGKPTEELAH
jgi:hypothetical protein